MSSGVKWTKPADLKFQAFQKPTIQPEKTVEWLARSAPHVKTCINAELTLFGAEVRAQAAG